MDNVEVANIENNWTRLHFWLQFGNSETVYSLKVDTDGLLY